ncbi:MAG: hypothetical protein ACLSAP_10790 [Oscillospiraceae bacterium]
MGKEFERPGGYVFFLEGLPNIKRKELVYVTFGDNDFEVYQYKSAISTNPTRISKIAKAYILSIDILTQDNIDIECKRTFPNGLTGRDFFTKARLYLDGYWGDNGLQKEPFKEILCVSYYESTNKQPRSIYCWSSTSNDRIVKKLKEAMITPCPQFDSEKEKKDSDWFATIISTNSGT